MNHNTSWFTPEPIAEKTRENRNTIVTYLNDYRVFLVKILRLKYQHNKTAETLEYRKKTEKVKAIKAKYMELELPKSYLYSKL